MLKPLENGQYKPEGTKENQKELNVDFFSKMDNMCGGIL